MKRRSKAKPVVAVPDAVAAGCTWSDWTSALDARITAKNATQSALAHAEVERIRVWLTDHSVDPAGCWNEGRFILDGDAVIPRAVWLREEREAVEKARQAREFWGR